MFFSDLGEVITESDHHFFYLCEKCKENGHNIDCKYVDCYESKSSKVFCTEVYLLPIFTNILNTQYLFTHF